VGSGLYHALVIAGLSRRGAFGRYLAFGLIALIPAWFDRRRILALSKTDWYSALKLAAVGNIIYYAALASAIQLADAAANHAHRHFASHDRGLCELVTTSSFRIHRLEKTRAAAVADFAASCWSTAKNCVILMPNARSAIT
jgi:hypothetical protein